MDKTRENLVTSFPLPCDDAEKLNLLLPDTVIFKGKPQQEWMDLEKQKQDLSDTKDIYMAELKDAFTFDMDDIQLYDEESQVGLIDQDESQFQDPDRKEEGNISEKLTDITYDTYFGDLGSITDIQFYQPDFSLPYTFKMAQNSCNKENRVCEMNIKLMENTEIKARHKIKCLLISWFLKNFGVNDYEIIMGLNLENFCKEKNKK